MPLEDCLVSRRTIKGNLAATIVPAERDNRGSCIAQMNIIAIAMIDISFRLDGHRASRFLIFFIVQSLTRIVVVAIN